MNEDAAYYEQEYFWAEEHTSEFDRQRIVDTAALIPDDARSLLDVGCGSGLFLNHLASRGGLDRLHGVDRSEIALGHVKTETTIAGADSLPFADGEFDVVTALEAIEHYRADVFSASLREMSRVCGKYIIISVPYRQNLRASLVECPTCFSRFNPDYHVRRFDERAMEELFDSIGGVRCVRTEYLGGYHGLVRPRVPTALRRPRKNPFAIELPCPVCRERIPGSAPAPVDEAGAEAAPPTPGLRGRLRDAILPFWPKRLHHRWIAAVYAKA